MSDGYTKLFSSILRSTVWREPNHVRITFIAMLALANRHGEIESSLPGLADMARVTLDECIDALKVLEAPDQYSRTKAHEGRRVASCDGGWVLLNYGKYRDKLAAEDRRTKAADRKRRERDRRREENLCVTERDSPQCHTESRLSRQAEAEAEADPKAEAEANAEAERTGGFRPPDSWEPNEGHAARALEMGISLAEEAERFRLYEFPKPIFDWDRRFSLWLVNARNYRRPGGTGGKSAGAKSALDLQAARIEALRAVAARQALEDFE
jgi:hypothetical protein